MAKATLVLTQLLKLILSLPPPLLCPEQDTWTGLQCLGSENRGVDIRYLETSELRDEVQGYEAVRSRVW